MRVWIESETIVMVCGSAAPVSGVAAPVSGEVAPVCGEVAAFGRTVSGLEGPVGASFPQVSIVMASRQRPSGNPHLM